MTNERMMRPSLPRLALIVGATLLIAACSGGMSEAAPTIEDPWLRSMPNGIGAAYMTITTSADDRLVGAETDGSVAGRVEVHEVVDDSGRMLMRQVEGGIVLPSDEPVQLRPGGFHLMLLDMPQQLEIGSRVTITLRFAEAGPVVITAEVREGAGSEPMHDSSMPHGDADHGSTDHGGTGHGSMHPEHRPG